MSKARNQNLIKLAYSGLFIALAFVLPFLTFQNPQLGNILCLMHIPVFLASYVCSYKYGMAVGFLSPLLRSLIMSRPPLFPTALSMAFELMFYGLLADLLRRLLPKKIPYLYLSLFLSMVGGRIVWGIVRFLIAGFSPNETFNFKMFLSGAVTTALPGIALQLLLIVPVVLALAKVGALPEIKKEYLKN